MSNVSYTVEAILKANDSGFSSAFENAQKSVSGLSSMAAKTGSMFKSILGANLVSGALTSGIGAISGGIRSMGTELNSSQKAWKTFGGNLQAFGRSSEQIAAAKSEMQDFATKTVYSASDMASTYSQLDAVGTKNVGSLVKAFGGLAASAEDPAQAMKTLSQQATQMAAKPTVQWQDFKLMMEQTPAGMAAVAKEMGMSTDELVAAVQNGQISTEDFFDAMNRAGNSDAFQKMATEFKTVDQAIDGAKENLANKLMPAFEKLSQFGIKAVNAVSNALDGINFDKFASSLGSVLSKIDVNAIVSKISSGISEVVGFLQTAKDKVVEFYKIFKGTGAVAGIQAAFEAIKNAIEHVFSSLKVNGDVITPLATMIGDAFVKISSYIQEAANWISKLDPGVIKTVAGAAAGAVAAFKGFKTVSNILNGVSKSFNLIKATLSANPFALAVVGIGALVGAFITAYNTSETFRNKVDAVVDSVKKFIDNLDMDQVKQWGAVIASVAGGFAIFKMLNGWNPFKAFGNGGKKALDDVKNALAGTSGQATQSKGIIEQVFSGLGTLITSIAKGISTVLQGLATALSTVATGFGQAAAMASPAQWLSMGAAMLMVGAGVALVSAGIYVLVQAAIQLASAGSGAAIALAGLGVGIAALAGVFALLGPALSAGAIGIVAFGAAVALIGAGVYAASAGLSMLAGHLPTIATYGASAAVGIAALGAGLLVMGAGAMVAGAGLVVVGAGLTVVGAGAVVAAAGAVALGAGLLAVAAGVAVFGAALNVGKPGLTAFANAITKVVNAISGGFVAILNSISGVITSVGQAALNAGKGFNQLASGVVKITNTNLGDMAASLAAVAVGVGKIAGQSAGLAQAGASMTKLGTGIRTVSTAATTAVAGLTAFATRITTLSTSVSTLPMMMTTAASGFANFTTQAVSGVAGLSAVNAPIAAFKAQIMTLTPAIMSATVGFTMFGARAMVINSTFAIIGGIIGAFNARILSMGAATGAAGASFGMLAGRVGALGGVLSSISGGFASVGASASSSASQMLSIISATQSVITAFNSMRAQVQSSMQAILTIVISIGNQMKAQGSIIGQQTSQNIAQGISSGVGTAASAMNALMSAVRSAGMSGVGSMRSIGVYIGQGLAQGMYSALGAVTAAANALVAQAERAAQAKAKIHSPSRLFRDNVGIYIGQGVAVGIERSQKYVDNAMDSMFDRIDNFNAQVTDMMSGEAVYGFDGGKFSNDIEVTYRNQDDAKLDTIREALDTIKTMASRDTVLNIDGREFARATGDDISDYQSRKQEVRNLVWGLGNNG